MSSSTHLAGPIGTTIIYDTAVQTIYITVYEGSEPLTSVTSDTLATLSTLTTSIPNSASIPTTALESGITSSATSSTTTALPAQSRSSDGLSPARKRAIIAGLCGAIGGLLIIALLLILCFRYRRANRAQRDARSPFATTEDHFSWKCMGFTPKLQALRTPVMTQVECNPPLSSASIVDPQQVIRIDTQHWSRPYQTGGAAGLRESMPPGQLRLVNPDLNSLPGTPGSYDISEPDQSTLIQPLTTTNQPIFQPDHNKVQPSIRPIPATLTQSHLRPPAPTYIPNFSHKPTILPSKPYPPSTTTAQTQSSTTLPIIIAPHDPEDPFLTPPNEKPLPTLFSSRPQQSHQSTQTTHPTNDCLRLPSQSHPIPHASPKVLGSDGLHVPEPASATTSRRSDPFDLRLGDSGVEDEYGDGNARDNGSVRWSAKSSVSGENDVDGEEWRVEKRGTPFWMMYEGT